MKVWNKIFILASVLAVGLMSPTALWGQQTATTVTADQVNEVARELWCPLCSGVRLDSCELKACEQMRQEIALKLEAGEDTESIKNYFLAQYGPQILGEPPRAGFNWLAWILPVVALVGGAAFLLVRGRRLFLRPALIPTPINSPPSDTDRHARQLEEELKRYG